MASDYTTREVPYEEAIAMIERARGVRFYMHAATWLPAVDGPPRGSEKRSGFVFSAALHLRRQEMLSFLRSSIAEKHRALVHIPIARGKRCMFVGGSV